MSGWAFRMCIWLPVFRSLSEKEKLNSISLADVDLRWKFRDFSRHARFPDNFQLVDTQPGTQAPWMMSCLWQSWQSGITSLCYIPCCTLLLQFCKVSHVAEELLIMHFPARCNTLATGIICLWKKVELWKRRGQLSKVSAISKFHTLKDTLEISMTN